MTIRRLTPDDWALFREIRLEMLTEAAEAFGSTFADWAAKPETEVRDWLTRMTCLGAFGRRDLLATASYNRASTQTTRHRAEVIAVYTRPAARGRGIAQALLSRLAETARAEGVIQLELQVAGWNTPALKAYETLGFERCGLIPRAVQHDGNFTDDVRMVWHLDQ